MSFELANPERLVVTALADAVAPPPPIDLVEWATENVTFGTESEFPGPYNPELFPFFSEILEVLSPDHPAREVVLAKSAQLGGTILAMIFIGSRFDLAPGPMLYTHPTDTNAIRWGKEKWKPFERGCNALKGRLAEAKERDGSRTDRYIERKDGRGWLTVSSANSAAQLSMLSSRVQVQDDLAKWEANKAGDPEGQADSRSEGFLTSAKIFKISTPLVWPGCRITKRFKQSDQRYFHVPCPHCGSEHVLEWENFKASLERDDDCADTVEEIAAGAHFTCPHCAKPIVEGHRAWMASQGRWVKHNPASLTPGFHIWSAYSPLTSWARIAAKWLSAKGDPEAERVFYNDTLGLAYETAGQAPPWEAIRDRAEQDGFEVGRLPPGPWILTAGIDCQKDRTEVLIRGFGPRLRRHTVEHIVIQGHVSEDETIAALDALLDQTWPDGLGNRHKLDQIAIDAGNWKSDVLGWVYRHARSRVIAVKGASSAHAPELGQPKSEWLTRRGKKVRGKRFMWPIGVSVIKAALYKHLEVTDPEARGYNSFPCGMGDEHYRQLWSEKREASRNRQGVEVWYWTKIHERNEVLDCAVYAEAAAIRCHWKRLKEEDWALLEAKNFAAPDQTQLDLEDPALPRGLPSHPARHRDGAPGSGPDDPSGPDRPKLRRPKGAVPRPRNAGQDDRGELY